MFIHFLLSSIFFPTAFLQVLRQPHRYSCDMIISMVCEPQTRCLPQKTSHRKLLLLPRGKKFCLYLGCLFLIIISHLPMCNTNEPGFFSTILVQTVIKLNRFMFITKKSHLNVVTSLKFYNSAQMKINLLNSLHLNQVLPTKTWS